MATIPLGVTTIFPWPVFQAYDTNGHPLVGGRLYTYEANSTVPKASFADYYFLTPNSNPVILDADGIAIVHLDGFYRLVLTDAQNVQLWEEPVYEFASGSPAPTSGLVTGMTEAVNVTPSAGSAVIAVPNLIPLGYRCEGIIIKITTDFGTSQGLASLAVGDATLLDRWGVCGLTTGTQTGQRDFRAADRPIAATAYSALISAIGGNFDSVGSLTCRGFWSSITGWS